MTPLRRKGALSLTAKEFIEREEALSAIAQREKAVRFLFWAYGGLLVFTGAVILLQGFGWGGFKMEAKFLIWLGGATIGEVAGLAALVYGSLFKHRDKE